MPGTPEHMAWMRSLRQQKLTSERRSAIARQGANGRWSFAKGGDIGRVNAMQRQLALVMLSALKHRDGDKALRTSLVMYEAASDRLKRRQPPGRRGEFATLHRRDSRTGQEAASSTEQGWRLPRLRRREPSGRLDQKTHRRMDLSELSQRDCVDRADRRSVQARSTAWR